MGDAVDRALSENHELINAILDHYSAGQSTPAVELLERLQTNLEYIAAVAEHGIPLAPSPPAHHPLPHSASLPIPTSGSPVPSFQHPLPSAIHPTDHPQVSAIPRPAADSSTADLVSPSSGPSASAIRTAPTHVPSSTVALLPRPTALPLAPAHARPPAAGPSTSIPQPNRTIAPAPLPPRTSGMGSAG